MVNEAVGGAKHEKRTEFLKQIIGICIEGVDEKSECNSI